VAGHLSFISTFTRDARIIILSNAVRSFVQALLAVAFPIYLSKIGAQPVVVGIAFMGIGLFSAVRSLIEGIVADRLGRKPVLLFISATLVAGGVIFYITTNLAVLLVAAVLFTVGGTITYAPAEVALLSEEAGEGSRTLALSVNATTATVAAILGNLAAALPEALQRLGFPEVYAYQQIFVLLTGAGVLSFILFAMLRDIEPEHVKEEKATLSEEEMGERRLLVRWSGVVALDQIGGSFNNLISYWYYLRFGVGPAEIGLVTGAGRLIATISFALGFRMARRLGTISATALSRVPIFLINAITPLMPSFGVVAAGRLVMSVFSDIDVPLRQSYIMGVTRSKVRASAYGVVQVVSRFTSAGAPAVTGYLYEFVSLSIPFYGAALFQAASAGSMYFIFKDIKPPEERLAREQGPGKE